MLRTLKAGVADPKGFTCPNGPLFPTVNMVTFVKLLASKQELSVDSTARIDRFSRERKRPRL